MESVLAQFVCIITYILHEKLKNNKQDTTQQQATTNNLQPYNHKG